MHKIKLLSHSITLKINDPSTWAESGMGRCHLPKLEILINNSMPPDIQGSTLIHELIHMIADMNSVKITEQQVDTISLGVYSFIKENPKMIDSIIKSRPLN